MPSVLHTRTSQTSASDESGDLRRTTHQRELACVLALAAIFMCFTWRGLMMFFSGDDMMNMYKAWTTPALKIWKAQLMPWMPLARPLGTAVYRTFYAIFGFHPLPLYIFCWLLLIGNVFAAWRFFRAFSPTVFVALLALSLTLVHGLFDDLYLSAGTIYDRLCFLFTVLAVVAYVRTRRDENAMSAGRIALLCFLCLIAMNSKESGAAVPAILFCHECIYRLPRVWRERRVRQWIRSIAPFYGLLAVLLAMFVFGRVVRIEDYFGNASYQPHLSFGFWLTNVAEYLNILLYRHVHFTPGTAAFTLTVMLALAAYLRSRAMLFGWSYFVIAITPVALISVRQGYVLYVPYPGLGLYFAALIGLAFTRLDRHESVNVRSSLSVAQIATLAAVTICVNCLHAIEWPAPWLIRDSREWRLTDIMRRNYPAMKPAAKILFVDDYPAGNPYDTMFVLRLLYHDPLIEVFRLKGPAELRPDPEHPPEFDHVFTTGSDTYIELDRRNVEESVRLNILKDYAPGRSFDTDRADRVGYVVSGIRTSGQGGGGWWTMRSATLKFDVYPADSALALSFFVPHAVATGKTRTLSVMVDSNAVGTAELTHEGMNALRFPVPARSINASGFTIVTLEVDDPYRDGDEEFGVVLRRAGFDYAPAPPPAFSLK